MTTPSPELRQCGRCRHFFPGDLAFEVDPVPKWWLCPACRTAFFGDNSARNQAARWD
jgi:hypothetical protein